MILPIVLLGAGGHAKVLIEALMASSAVITGIVDKDPSLVGTTVLGVPVIGTDDILMELSPSEIRLVNGIGSIGHPRTRANLFDIFKDRGYTFATVIHPSAIVASDTLLDEGAQLMAGSVIQPGSHIGYNTIINTRASIDHDCIIGEHTHIAPGVTLSGNVTIGAKSHIGTGATVIQGISIGDKCIVGAGALVLNDVQSGITVMGVPAKKVNR